MSLPMPTPDQQTNQTMFTYMPHVNNCGLQAWAFPTKANRIGAIMSGWAVKAGGANTVLAVNGSTLFGAVHGKDTQAMLDGPYGDQVHGAFSSMSDSLPLPHP